MAFAFYDTETSSLHTAHAQILQFAAVLSDDQLNEVDHFEIRSRLLPYVVPSPSAMLVNRISARDLIDVKYPSHYGMMQRIREKLLSWSPAVFVGFNSLGFDEHLLRQAFYKTLHPIYLTNQALNSGNVLEGPLRDRIADGGKPGCQGQVATHLRRMRGGRRMTQMGHLHPYAMSSATGSRAPIPAVRGTAMEPPESLRVFGCLPVTARGAARRQASEKPRRRKPRGEYAPAAVSVYGDLRRGSARLGRSRTELPA